MEDSGRANHVLDNGRMARIASALAAGRMVGADAGGGLFGIGESCHCGDLGVDRTS